jgi:hypothetical protein
LRINNYSIANFQALFDAYRRAVKGKRKKSGAAAFVHHGFPGHDLLTPQL